ncbi:SPOR domain-containing protein [Vreelandella rituensis]|uniref:SPOR domain-containing protein n=1 Tax=Vreelandella rituensis TaxID=2282306 RepID=A0A368U771_9GAMM|nr:SPOR domain-containing protein [Halomonas rituensis]RCV92794.1 SPOR domain-containing protein [Halomonas rituensis]
MASPRKTPARRGATSQRKAPRAKHSRWRVPGWVWGLAGMAAGFFLAQHQHGTAPWQEQATSPPQATVLPKPSTSQEREAAQEAEAAEPAMPTFEFYTLLPETEVIAPGATLPSTASRPPIPAKAMEEEAASEAPQSDPIAQVIAANTRPDEQAPSKPAAAAEAHRYMLQAASFREISDAEQLRQRLRNLSLLAQISEVQAGGDTWHRVQVGPYDDTRELNRAQDLMNTQGIEPLLIQLQN